MGLAVDIPAVLHVRCLCRAPPSGMPATIWPASWTGPAVSICGTTATGVLHSCCCRFLALQAGRCSDQVGAALAIICMHSMHCSLLLRDLACRHICGCVRSGRLLHGNHCSSKCCVNTSSNRKSPAWLPLCGADWPCAGPPASHFQHAEG